MSKIKLSSSNYQISLLRENSVLKKQRRRVETHQAHQRRVTFTPPASNVKTKPPLKLQEFFPVELKLSHNIHIEHKRLAKA